MQTDLVVLVLLALSVTGTAAHAPRAIPMTRTVQKRNVDKRTTPEQLSGKKNKKKQHRIFLQTTYYPDKAASRWIFQCR